MHKLIIVFKKSKKKNKVKLYYSISSAASAMIQDFLPLANHNKSF